MPRLPRPGSDEEIWGDLLNEFLLSAHNPDGSLKAAALAGKESAITPSSPGHYWRGDKTWQPLTKQAVNLGNVDDTADIDKPVSSAMQAALQAKLDRAEALALAVAL